MKSYKIGLVVASLLFVWLQGGNADNPCAARQIDGESVVCVCNNTYCDDITRTAPSTGQFVAYISSEGGLRFSKTIGDLEKSSESVVTDDEGVSVRHDCCSTSLTVNPSVQYQAIQGFGGAVTDTVGILWRNLSQPLQTSLINSYFGENGLEYNMVRVPIGGSDFSTRVYSYNELPEDDVKLSNFSLAYEDYHYKLPMIKEIMKTSKTPVHIIGTTWSPPLWMKSNKNITGLSHLMEEYYQTYADYHLKFLQQYEAEGVRLWGITTTNEPTNGVIPQGQFNSLGWTPDHMGKWIVNNLGPTIRNSSFKDLTILTHDDQRYVIPLWFDEMLRQHPEALNYIDGIGVHYYLDNASPASILSNVAKKYPGKLIIATEASEGALIGEVMKVILGSWTRARLYIEDILEDLNNEVSGWIDWNICLNEQGGPNWQGKSLDSPIIVRPQDQEFVKQPMFYAMGHFSKFIPRGSIRIKVDEKKPLIDESVENVAFLTPRGSVVVVVYNGGSERTVAIRLGDQQARVKLDKHSVATVELEHKSSTNEN